MSDVTCPTSVQPAHRRHIWLCRAVIIAACLVMYGQSVNFGFTTLDDDYIIAAIADRNGNIGEALISDATMEKGGSSFYRPLQTISYMQDAKWSGKSPKAYHVTNLALFALACSALFSLLLALDIAAGPACAGTLLFTIHPMFAPAAVWIPARGDLLLALFGTLSMTALIRYRTSRSPLAMGGHFFAFALALLSKESAVMLPPVYALFLLTDRRPDARHAKLPRLLLIGWPVLIACFLALRSIAVHGVPDQNSFGPAAMAMNLATLPETLTNLFWPLGLGPLPAFTPGRTLAGLLIACGIALFSWKCRQGRPLIILGSAWYLCLSLPGMLFSHELGGHAYNYLHHRALFPLIGVMIILLQIFPAPGHAPWRILPAAVIILAVPLAILAHRQALNFADPMAFYTSAIRTNPGSTLAYTNRGILYAMQGNFGAALGDFDRALAITPSYYLALSNRATARGEMGDHAGAMQDLNEAIRQQPAFPMLFNNRGRLKLLFRDYAGAEADFTEALRLDSNLAIAYSNLGLLHATMGNDDSARRDLEKATKLNPAIGETWRLLGSLSAKSGEMQEACGQWQNAMRLGDPEAAKLTRQYCR